MRTRQKVRKALLLISFLLFPLTIYYFSPVLVIMGSSEGIITGSLVVFAAMFISSLFLGRLFCGWLCPVGGLQEALFVARDKKVSSRYNWIKYLIWVPWIILIGFVAFGAGGYKKIDVFYQTTNGISVAEPSAYIIYYSVVSLTLILALVIGKRSFCHNVCWMAPFMIIGQKISTIIRLASLRLMADKAKCSGCLSCNNNCPMSLEVSQMVQKENMYDSECILCGTCADTCPKGTIRYDIGFRDHARHRT